MNMVVKHKRNLIFSLLLGLSILIPSTLTIFNFLNQKPTHTYYLTLKLDRGFWWTSTQNNPPSLLDNLTFNLSTHDLPKKNIITLVSKKIYPNLTSSGIKYNAYVILQLNTPKDIKKTKLFFNRQHIAIGEPLEIKFNNIVLSGSIINISTHPSSNTQEYNIILTKKNAYPWELESIKLGNAFFDGQQEVLSIKNKSCLSTKTITSDTYGNYLPQIQNSMCYLTVKGTITLEKHNQILTFGPEQGISPGITVSLPTTNGFLTDFTIADISPNQPSPQTKK